MGGKQLGFTDHEITKAKKETQREKFFSEIELLVPWQEMIELSLVPLHGVNPKERLP